MCRFKLSALYCVKTKTRRKSELMQFERVMSTMRYSAPNGTAGLARSRVSGHRRSPWPPARSTPMASRMSDMSRASWMCLEKRLILRNGKAEYKRGERREGGGKGGGCGSSRERQNLFTIRLSSNTNDMRWVQYHENWQEA